MRNCSFVSVDPCHQLILCTKKGLRTVELEEKRILALRSNVQPSDIITICNHHEQALDKQFSKLLKTSSDPFRLHESKPRTKSLRIISLDFYAKTSSLEGKVVPGDKLCVACKRQATALAQQSVQAEESTTDESAELVTNDTNIDVATAGPSGIAQLLPCSASTTTVTSDAAAEEPEISLLDANAALEILGETPVKKSK
jgi:hypothetical protein